METDKLTATEHNRPLLWTVSVILAGLGVLIAYGLFAEFEHSLLSVFLMRFLNNYEIIVIADHGNSDLMINPDGSPHTAHSINPVPIFYLSSKTEMTSIRINPGKLADIAPTILFLMGLEPAEEMAGNILITAI